MTALDKKLFAAFQHQLAFCTGLSGLFVWANRKAFLSYPKPCAGLGPSALSPPSKAAANSSAGEKSAGGSRVAQSSALHLSKAFKEQTDVAQGTRGLEKTGSPGSKQIPNQATRRAGASERLLGARST